MSLVSLVIVALIGSFCYRLASAKSVADFRRIHGLFQYLAVVALIVVCGYAALGLLQAPANLDVLSFIILLLLVAAAVLPVFDARFVAVGGACLVLLDENNPFSIKVVILIAFLVAVLLGTIVGSRFFRRIFEGRMDAAKTDAIGGDTR